MSRSMPKTANFIGKLHAMAVRSLRVVNADVKPRLYPVVDGLHVVADDKDQLVLYLRELFVAAAVGFILEKRPQHHFVIRAGVAYGPLWEGRDLMSQFDRVLSSHTRHSESILLGPPTALAYAAESEASPFGIWVDESALVLLEPRVDPTSKHLRWWKYAGPVLPEELASTLAAHLDWYLDWCVHNSQRLSYNIGRIRIHRLFAQEYFGRETWPQ